MKKTIITVGLSTILLSGCLGVPTNTPHKQNEPAVHIKSPSKEDVRDTSGNSSNQTETSTSVKTNTKEPTTTKPTGTEDQTTTSSQPSSSTITEKGVFYGLADTNSVEIEVGKTNDIYKFRDALYEKVNKLPYEAKITFSYREENGDKIIFDVNQEN